MTFFLSFHCEGRIVTTLFGLLFWDIIFGPVPGAFETMYQTAPLDIAEDTFYLAREEVIRERLEQIKAGQAVEILATMYDQHCEKQPVAVGVRWDMFEKEELLEIAHVCFFCTTAFLCMS